VNTALVSFEIQMESELIWDSLNESSIPYLDKHFLEIAPRLAEYLIKALIDNQNFDVGIFSDNKTKGSIVSYDVFNSDKQLVLKMTNKRYFEIEIFIYDDDGKIHTYNHRLTKDELKIVPEGLKNIMKEVMLSMEGQTVSANSLSS
jgi:hypothetical protein